MAEQLTLIKDMVSKEAPRGRPTNWNKKGEMLLPGGVRSPQAWMKRFAQGVKAFRKDPVFTYEAKADRLVFRAGSETYKLKLSFLGFGEGELTDGQSIRVDLKSWGLKQPKAERNVIPTREERIEELDQLIGERIDDLVRKMTDDLAVRPGRTFDAANAIKALTEYMAFLGHEKDRDLPEFMAAFSNLVILSQERHALESGG